MSGNNSVSKDVSEFEETMRYNQRDLRTAKSDTEELKQDLSNISSKFSYDIDELYKDSLDIVQTMLDNLLENEDQQTTTEEHFQKQVTSL